LPVEIPPILLQRLQGLGARFIRVAARGKQPVDAGWPSRPMHHADPHLQAWLKEGGNYGVVCGFGLVVVDLDTPRMKEAPLPQTFKVETPGCNGWHLYFKCSLQKSMRVRVGGKYAAEIMSVGRMAVGPGSVHPNGEAYRIIDGSPMAPISERRLTAILGLKAHG